jgi:acyl carrier protein
MSVEADLRAMIMKKAPEGTEIGRDSKLIDVGLDSLDVIEIVFEVEDKYGIQLPQNDKETGSATFKDLCELVEKHIAAKAAEDGGTLPAT